MFFSSRMAHDFPVFNFSGGEVQWVSEYKYLGLILTNGLSFGRHISKVALNVSRISGMISNIRSFIPRHILMKIYEALAVPHIHLHLELWGSSPEYQMSWLEIKINNLLRTILGVRRINNIPVIGVHEMFQTLGILNLKSHYRLKMFKFLHSLVTGKFPEEFDFLLRPYLANHNYGTRGGTFRHPNLTCEVERRFLTHQLIILHEQTPPHLFQKSLAVATGIYKQSLLATQ